MKEFVFVKFGNEKSIIEKAAELAVKYSKSIGKTKVVWTKRKYVTKTKEHNNGQVNVDYKNSKFITIYKDDLV